MPTVITQGAATAKAYGFSAQAGAVRGCAVYTTPGTYTFTVPAGVTSISVVAIGGGGVGTDSAFWGPVGCCSCYYYYSNGIAGRGGGLGYTNNYTVSPGQTLTVVVGKGLSFCCMSNRDSSVSTCLSGAFVAGYGAYSQGPGAGGGYVGCGGGYGGGGGDNSYYSYFATLSTPPYYSGGGGGAGGYSGAGGDGAGWYYCGCGCYYSPTSATAGCGGGGGGGCHAGYGGGTGLYGQGSNGAAGGGTGSATWYPCCIGNFGGGGGGSYTFTFVSCSGPCGFVALGAPSMPGHNGAVRIVYPGTTRQFPSCDVGYP